MVEVEIEPHDARLDATQETAGQETAGQETAGQETGLDVGALVANAVDAMRKVIDEMTRLAQADPSETVAALKDAGKAASDSVADLGQARLDDLSAAVRRNPLAWLAGALGAGLIIGLWKNRGGRS